jgi:hypothetical protein
MLMMMMMMMKQGGLVEYNAGLQPGRPLTQILLTGSAPERMYRLCFPPGLLSKVYRGAFPADNAAGKRDDDHTTPSRVEVKSS